MRSLVVFSLLVALVVGQVTTVTGDSSQTTFVGDLVLEATATLHARFDTPITVTGRATINGAIRVRVCSSLRRSLSLCTIAAHITKPGKLELLTRKGLTNFVVLQAAALQGSFSSLVVRLEREPVCLCILYV